MMLRPQASKVLFAVLSMAVLSVAQGRNQAEAGGPGIVYGALPASPWQMRFGMTGGELRSLAAEAEPAGRRLSLFGDYYIPRGFGLRATGGLVLGRRAADESLVLWPTLGHRLDLASSTPHSWVQEEPASQDQGLARDAAPYFGLGYTGSTVRGSLGFFADVGWRGLVPSTNVRLGDRHGTGLHKEADPESWRAWREWRFEPVFQLGVSYAF